MSRCQTTKTRRRARAVSGNLPDDLYDYINEAAAVEPQQVRVTEAEIDLFEAWFGDILDELFGKPG